MFGIVIPCYNEEKRLPVQQLVTFLQRNEKVVLCFSNDGSSDNTLELLESMKEKFPKRILVNNLVLNSGKAEAVRTGVLGLVNEFSELDAFGYCDADLSTPLSEMMRLYSLISQDSSLKVVFGARWSRLGALINRRNIRHYLGRIIATHISASLKLPIYDSQCGAKIFRTSTIDSLFKEKFMSKWLFDVEIFARGISSYGYNDVNQTFKEVALNRWDEVEGSKVTIMDGLKAFRDVYNIRRKYIK